MNYGICPPVDFLPHYDVIVMDSGSRWSRARLLKSTARWPLNTDGTRVVSLDAGRHHRSLLHVVYSVSDASIRITSVGQSTKVICYGRFHFLQKIASELKRRFHAYTLTGMHAHPLNSNNCSYGRRKGFTLNRSSRLLIKRRQ